MDVDALRPKLGECTAQPSGRLRVRELVALRRHDEEARRPLAGAATDALEQGGREHRLVRDNEHVLLRLARLLGGHNVLDGNAWRGARDLSDDIAPQPPRPARPVRRDDDLVGGRLELGEGVLHGLDGTCLHDEPVRTHPRVA